jgi:hypothetical protein
MKFNSTTSYDGAIQDCETLTGLGKFQISSNSDRLKDFTRLLNVWYRVLDTKIWKAVGDWEFDDSNYSTLPDATTDLTAGQHDYALPSIARKIDRVEVLDANGDYQLLTPIDKSQVTAEAMSEFEEEDGMPEYYDMVGRSILLYPAPAAGSVTTTNGLRIYTPRDIVEFSSSATTREFGFDNHFHRFVTLGASYDWCLTNGLKKTPILRQELDRMDADIQQFYGSQNRDYKSKFRVTEDYLY